LVGWLVGSAGFSWVVTGTK